MRKIDYLFLRDGSRNWHVRLQYPGARLERSLGTPDRAQAEILALPYVQQHKLRLLESRPGIQLTWKHRFEPGREHVSADGERIIATERELIYLDSKGQITGRVPNGEMAVTLPPLRQQRAIVRREIQRARNATSADDAIIETYLKHSNVAGYSEREARAVWSLYKQLTSGKSLKEATRDDGRKIVQYFEAQGARSATIQKKVGWLNAAVNLAIKETKLQFNPFSSIVPKRSDKQKRLPLDEADIRNLKRNLDLLDQADQLLLRLLATTGMRLSEAFEVDGEEKERGCRFVIVGKKTEQSLRRVPLPAGALPFLPEKIKGPLFDGTGAAASKRLNRFLRDCGIADPRKVLHSLRHRAQDRLRAAGCPQDVRWALLGHEEKTVADGYGEGFPVKMLREWIDRIGF